MSWERMVGWRYLYGGRRDPTMVKLAAGCLAMIAIGFAILAISTASSLGVGLVITGMIGAAIFGLLSTFSVFVSVSTLGVALGVAALTTVLAVTTGFQQQFREKVLGVNAHVIVLKQQTTFAEYRDVMKRARHLDPVVIATQPFIFAEMLVTRGKGELAGVAIKGIDPKLVRSVLDLDKHMIAGSIDSLEDERDDGGQGPGTGRSPSASPTETDRSGDPPIIIGKELSIKLKAKLGDHVTVVVPLSNMDLKSFRGSAPRTKRFRVTGIFYSGFDEYDRRLMYSSLRDIQDLVGRGDQVMGVELKLRDLDRASEIAVRLEKALGGAPFQVQDWYELNQNLFTALNVQKIVLVIILTLIIIVAAVNMVSALSMMVTDKTREIAIMKSMGSTSGSVAKIFITVGLVIGAAGTLVGVSLGLVICFVVGRYGYHLDSKVYLIDRLPIEVRPLEVLLVCVITMVVAMLATIVPAYAANAMRPVDGLRYD